MEKFAIQFTILINDNWLININLWKADNSRNKIYSKIAQRMQEEKSRKGAYKVTLGCMEFTEPCSKTQANNKE